MSNIPLEKQSKLESLALYIIEFVLTYSGISYIIDLIEKTKNKYFLWVADKCVFLGITLISVFCSGLLVIYELFNKPKSY